MEASRCAVLLDPARCVCDAGLETTLTHRFGLSGVLSSVPIFDYRSAA